jgi:CheY-like chemotaxis protein/nucleoside phosphorylase/two-component sensor histidine kinase
MNSNSIDLAIVVALSEEFDQFFSEFCGHAETIRDPEYGSYYYRFDFAPNGPSPIQTVGCFIGGMGPDLAGRQMERLFQRWSPRFTAVVGICGGIHGDVLLGDVVVPSTVDAYLSATKAVSGADETFSLQHRGTEYECDHEIVQEARHLKFARKHFYERWQNDCSTKAKQLLNVHLDELSRKGLLASRPRIKTGPIASGPVVSASASFKRWLLERNATYEAIEMEAAGAAAAAAERIQKRRCFSIRGVADLADERKSNLETLESGALRRVAMGNALRLLSIFGAIGLFSETGGSCDALVSYTSPRDLSQVEHQTRILTEWMLRPVGTPVLHQDLSGIRILFVEDNPVNLKLLSGIARRFSAEATLARSGHEALEVLQRGTVFDVVVTDIVMPGLDGLALAHIISERFPLLPVVFFSAWLEYDAPVQDCVASLRRPCKDDAVVSIIRDVVRNPLKGFLVEHLPEVLPFLTVLLGCRYKVTFFVDKFNGAGIFETAFRDKLKDGIANFAREIIERGSPRLAIDKLVHQVNKLTSLLRQGRISQGSNFVDFLNMLVEDASKQAKDVQVEVDVDREATSGLGQDASTALCIALVELLDNAVEALNGHGKVRISLYRLNVRQQALLSVWSPTGPLSGSVESNIFVEGFSTKGPERGMGLNVIRKLAERFGGGLALSQGQDGVEFCVTLPVADETPKLIRTAAF